MKAKRMFDLPDFLVMVGIILLCVAIYVWFGWATVVALVGVALVLIGIAAAKRTPGANNGGNHE